MIAVVALAPACGGGGGDGQPGGAARSGGEYEEDVRTIERLLDSAGQRLKGPRGPEEERQEVTAAAEELHEAANVIDQANPPARAADANARLQWALWAARDAGEDARLTVADGYKLSADERDRLLDAIREAQTALRKLKKLDLGAGAG